MIRTNIFLLAMLLVVLFSCKKNDSATITLREYSEVAVENDVEIQSYLKTHFYTFNNTDGTIMLDTISGTNAGKTSLFDQVKKKVIKIRDIHSNYVNHTMYYLVVREGSGTKATVADSSFVTYKGQTLKGVVFDQSRSIAQSNWLDLLGNGTQVNAGVVVGFREGVSLLKASAKSVTEESGGMLKLPDDYGVGLFFLPSGIAYFSGSGNIPAYSPLIFQINLISTKNADHDADGIPSIKEIEYNETDGTIAYPDCNGNGISDYVDAKKCN